MESLFGREGERGKTRCKSVELPIISHCSLSSLEEEEGMQLNHFLQMGALYGQSFVINHFIQCMSDCLTLCVRAYVLEVCI